MEEHRQVLLDAYKRSVFGDFKSPTFDSIDKPPDCLEGYGNVNVSDGMLLEKWAQRSKIFTLSFNLMSKDVLIATKVLPYRVHISETSDGPKMVLPLEAIQNLARNALTEKRDYKVEHSLPKFLLSIHGDGNAVVMRIREGKYEAVEVTTHDRVEIKSTDGSVTLVEVKRGLPCPDFTSNLTNHLADTNLLESLAETSVRSSPAPTSSVKPSLAKSAEFSNEPVCFPV